ncbi:YafY family transcriptional regulator [Enterococcus ureasiticus]|uniref:helix-turn-helix transcriptional regulator n=1 Tax=Enterococcus ureasiticus TaxID=903984 RepID=UPI001A8ED681|nr:YafY family protein [Enterococcus ureasiticus]MBO0475132.1 YafY family transcriptional regulator [Enterococcus ureasiticus]
MKKIERILAIIVLLLENEIVSTAQLAQRFEVTKRTIFRDIETIELAGFPIISHPGRKGGFSLVDSFKLRTYTYSGEEKQDILNALNIKEGLFGISDQQNTIKEKITLIQQKNNQKGQLKKQFSFESPTMHRLEIEVETKRKINYINLSLKQNRKVIIDYVDNKGDHTQRTIHPYELMLMNGSWYIYSYCEERDAFKYFKVTRIRQLMIQERTFEPVEYSNTRLIEPDEDVIQLRFKKEDLGKLYDYYTEDEIEVEENHVDVRVYANQQKTIIPFLLMFGNGVKVIAPEKLKERHKQEIIKLNETY